MMEEQRHGVGSSHLDPYAEDRERHTGDGVSLSKASESTPSDTSNKTTPSNPSQTVLPTGSQIVKHIHQWETFSFILPWVAIKMIVYKHNIGIKSC